MFVPSVHFRDSSSRIDKKACSNAALVDRPCGTNLSSLWLDVVAVIDNSDGMTSQSMQSVIATLSTVFEFGTVIGTDPSNPRTTRVGIVTYNEQATVKADLDKYQGVTDFANSVSADIGRASQNSTSYLETGLAAAEQLFIATQGTARDYYKKVIIVFASTYEGNDNLDPVPTAERLTSSGVTIITVAYVQTANVLRGLEKVATPHQNFTNAGQENAELITKIQNSLLQANCFCGSLWTQYRVSFADEHSQKFGVCNQLVNLPANWKSAQISCRNRFKNAYLANEYNQAKHDFLVASVQKAGFPQPLSYHIGLFYNVNKWVWDQPEGWNQQDVSWTYWTPGFPLSSGSNSAGINYQYNQGAAWKNIPLFTYAANYICEVASCDTDNFCTADDYYG
uniref:VWFA domain-containing protein n=1 Tax=Caenorhabditis tropicalis TaxID=1561998 RepID=A0A1I7UTF0_9PELO